MLKFVPAFIVLTRIHKINEKERNFLSIFKRQEKNQKFDKNFKKKIILLTIIFYNFVF
ncbi:MAG: hypothetical protein CH6_1505 [Candidatus Kapaibacterium sp.]|nr:MAG: hypothetical protein CH6_1505 [Candidatus Kapabacteria bacterium]